MPIQVQGFSGVVAEVESAFRAMRIVQHPKDVGALGAYGLGATSGVMAAGLAANSEIFQMRWIHASNMMVPRSIMLSCGKLTAFAAGIWSFVGTVARGWSADGTGGTPIVFSTNNTNKKRTSFALSSFSDTGVRIASTAALGAGTKTLDTNNFAAITGNVSSVATTAAEAAPIAPTMLWQRNTADEYPFAFAQNEGFVIRATVPATGTWMFSVTVEWAELASY